MTLGAVATGWVVSCLAYVPSESTQRIPIRWARATSAIAVDVTGSQDVLPAQANDIIASSLHQWNTRVPFRLQTTLAGANKFSFSSDARYFGPGVVALTMLSYAPGDGRIIGGSILMNQATFRGFCFTADAAASNCTAPGRHWDTRIYLGDVVTHELGHFMGLGHSEVRDASMVFSAARGQASPHPDDVAGVRHIYARSDSGSITGSVRGGSAIGVFGAHVQAISLRTGKVAAAALSDETGEFHINGLDLEDSYHLYVEPLRRLSALPDAFRSAKASFCPGSYVGSFFETCAGGSRGKPQRIRLTRERPALDVGVVSVRCQLRVGEEYMAAKLSEGRGRYQFRATTTEPERSFVGLYYATDDLPVDFFDDARADEIDVDLRSLTTSLAGHALEVSVVTTALGSALDFSVSIEGPFGTLRDPDRTLLGGVPQPARESGTQKRIYDRRFLYPLASSAADNFLRVKLRPRGLRPDESFAELPAFETFGLTDRPWLVQTRIVSAGTHRFSSTAPVVEDNSSCLDAPFTYAVKASGVSSAALAGKSEAAPEAQASAPPIGCGSIGDPPNSSGGGAALLLVLGFASVAFAPRRSRII